MPAKVAKVFAHHFPFAIDLIFPQPQFVAVISLAHTTLERCDGVLLPTNGNDGSFSKARRMQRLRVVIGVLVSLNSGGRNLVVRLDGAVLNIFYRPPATCAHM